MPAGSGLRYLIDAPRFGIGHCLADIPPLAPVLPDIESVAAKVHEAWMEAKRSAGVNSRKLESGEELMVPYRELSEEAKELDRATVRAVYAAIKLASV